jgi:N-acetylglucosaminyl-diphospho-decaprenol L-rhamnosyltransferase
LAGLNPTVVVATMGRIDAMRRLLGTLAEQTVEVEAIVVDNGSGDPELQALVNETHFATYVGFDRNLGYSRAVNEGAWRADGDTLILLNDDSACEPAYVEELLAVMDPAAGVGMASGVLTDPWEPNLIDSAGVQLDHTLMIMDYLNGEDLGALGSAKDPIGPVGASAAIDRAAFAAVGGFDEGIFAYWEDVDLVLRLRRAGLTCALAREARAAHEHSATLGAGSSAKNYLMGFGRGYVLRKWGVLSPARTGPVILREAAVCAAQLAADRNLAGVRGRVAGYRAASRTYDYPDELTSEWSISMREGLLARFRRRRRLKQRT